MPVNLWRVEAGISLLCTRIAENRRKRKRPAARGAGPASKLVTRHPREHSCHSNFLAPRVCKNHNPARTRGTRAHLISLAATSAQASPDRGSRKLLPRKPDARTILRAKMFSMPLGWARVLIENSGEGG